MMREEKISFFMFLISGSEKRALLRAIAAAAAFTEVISQPEVVERKLDSRDKALSL